MFSLSKSVSKLKSISKKNKSNDLNTKQSIEKIKHKSKKSKKLNKESNENKDLIAGVVMIGNIPHGFYEKQMFSYFSQFGKVLRLRISRNRKTGKSRKYAFIEFECEEVAKIVANTMNNYLMFDHILKCKFIDKEKVSPKLFHNWNREFVSTTAIHKSLHNKNKTFEREIHLMKKRLKNVRQMETTLAENGIEFKCDVVNRPDSTKRKELMIVDSSDDDMAFKTPPNAIRVSKSKSENVVKDLQKKKIKVVGVTPRRSVRFPKLHKFSIIRAANKRKSL